MGLVELLRDCYTIEVVWGDIIAILIIVTLIIM